MTYFDDFAGNFVAAEMKEQKKEETLHYLVRSLKAQRITMEGRFSAFLKSKDLQDLAGVAYYAGKMSATLRILEKDYGYKDTDGLQNLAWNRVLDAVAVVEETKNDW